MNQDSSTADQDSVDHKRPVEEHLKERSTWLRLLFMAVVALLSCVCGVVVSVVVLLQFCWKLFTGETNPQLDRLGQSLASYMYQIVRYLTFNTEQRPFPFDEEWPNGPP